MQNFKFRKKPIVIEAFQLFYNPNEILSREKLKDFPAWFHDALCKFKGEEGGVFLHANGLFVIVTLEGLMEISSGDYVIQGIKGEIYPCKSDIFEASYEGVEE